MSGRVDPQQPLFAWHQRWQAGVSRMARGNAGITHLDHQVTLWQLLGAGARAFWAMWPERLPSLKSDRAARRLGHGRAGLGPRPGGVGVGSPGPTLPIQAATTLRPTGAS